MPYPTKWIMSSRFGTLAKSKTGIQNAATIRIAESRSVGAKPCCYIKQATLSDTEAVEMFTVESTGEIPSLDHRLYQARNLKLSSISKQQKDTAEF
jgi:hypothetical protein